ncbi:MAG: hypothetical protein JSR50_11560 [Proteobacteria bacterium]|nr:hypothetical protein [Pseudomonadota bacterium]
MSGAKKPNKSAVARANKAPREVRPAWELSETEKDRFIRTHHLDRLFKRLHPNVHPDDREILFNGIAAAESFHELSKIIDSLYWDDSSDDLRDELESVRVGFELALQALDRALDDRAIELDRPRLAGLKRAENDPKAKAMHEIRREWENRQQPGRGFAKEMAFKYQQEGVDLSEGGIKNAISRWRRESSSN